MTTRIARFLAAAKGCFAAGLIGAVVLSTAAVQAAPFAYVTNFSSATVSVVDVATNTVAATVSVGLSPVGVAITPDGTRVYVTNGGTSTVSVISTATNTDRDGARRQHAFWCGNHPRWITGLCHE